MEEAERGYRSTMQNNMEQMDALSTCNIKIASLETELKAELKYHEDAKSKIATLEREAKEKDKLLSAEGNELDELHEVISGLEKELADDRDSNAKTLLQFSDQIDGLNTELQNKAQSIGESNATITSMKCQLDEKSKTTDSHRDQISKLQRDLAVVEKATAATEYKMKILSDKLKDAESKNAKLTGELKELTFED